MNTTQALQTGPKTFKEIQKLTGLNSLEILESMDSSMETIRGSYGRIYLRLVEAEN